MNAYPFLHSYKITHDLIAEQEAKSVSHLRHLFFALPEFQIQEVLKVFNPFPEELDTLYREIGVGFMYRAKLGKFMYLCHELFDIRNAAESGNKNGMFFDLGLVLLGGAMGAATLSALGSLCYGGYVAFSAAASGKVGVTAMAVAGGKALGAYSVGAAAHLAPHVGVGLAVDFGKGQIYSRMPKINTSDGERSLLELRDGKDGDSILDSKETQETITKYATTEGGNAGGVYPIGPNSTRGVWDSDNFVRTTTNPSRGAYWDLMREQASNAAGRRGAGINPLAKGDNRRSTIIDAVTDGVKIFRSLYLIESKHEIETEGKRLEAEAKKGIKVVENDI